MDNQTILNHIDHTLLKPVATWEQIEKLCEEAVSYHTASVCIPPCYIARVRQMFPTLNICTVIGFPLGYNTTEVKIFEAERAIGDGADEVDIVINITDVKNGNFDVIESEIKAIKDVVEDHILKVIVETCYLTVDEKIQICECVANAGADYIKTSTGFGIAGATLEDIEIFKANIGENIKIKASGGIKTAEDAENYIKAGCDRVGASSVISDIVK